MAWRDSRRNRGRLLLFLSSIVLGIAALVAINSFNENLVKDIEKEAKTLLGADLNVESRRPVSDTLQMLFDSLGGEQSQTIEFISMAYFPKNGGTRLAQIVGLEGDYPFYGKFNTEPVEAGVNFKKGKNALVDKTLMIQFDMQPGDSISVGTQTFLIAGELKSVPGRSGIASSVAPAVFIPMEYLEATGLLQTGSRVEYDFYFKFPEQTDIAQMMENLSPRFRAASVRWTTVEERKQSIGEAFSRMSSFLNLVGFIALLLGCIGVASAVHIYVKDKLSTVAILRCLGTSGRQAFLIYLIQILVMGLFGALLGAVLGSVLQVSLPVVLGEFLPVQNVSNDISWSAISMGVLTGLSISILFALLPLLAIRRTSPLRTLRASFEEAQNGIDPLRYVIYLLIILAVISFTYLQTKDLMTAIIFPISIVIMFGLLTFASYLLTKALRKFFPVSWSYVWRQGIANLYRPNNQTLVLMVSIGLGTAFISMLFLIQSLLLSQVEFSGQGQKSNMILFDIQPSQHEEVIQIANTHNLPILQEVPIVTMRMDKIDGMNKQQMQEDSTRHPRGWVFNREYRVTYRDTLIDSETITEGQWHGELSPDTIYISLAEDIAEDMDVKIGSHLTFNVQGALVPTIVSSFRKIDWGRLQTNFFVVFPTGVLEKAPQFNVIASRTENVEQSARFQQNLIQRFPNVSVIDLTQVLKTLDDILNKVSFVIRFMAMFSILTGLLVLISSVILSKYQRIQESVLLRTLGAKSRQILFINAIEYMLLGSLATITGVGLSVIGAWLITHYQFKVPFTPDWWPLIIIFVTITSLTILIGLLNSREVLNKPPLEVLRQEV